MPRCFVASDEESDDRSVTFFTPQWSVPVQSTGGSEMTKTETVDPTVHPWRRRVFALLALLIAQLLLVAAWNT